MPLIVTGGEYFPFRKVDRQLRTPNDEHAAVLSSPLEFVEPHPVLREILVHMKHIDCSGGWLGVIKSAKVCNLLSQFN